MGEWKTFRLLLGVKYMDVTFLIVHGCYNINIGRTVASIVMEGKLMYAYLNALYSKEQNHS